MMLPTPPPTRGRGIDKVLFVCAQYPMLVCIHHARHSSCVQHATFRFLVPLLLTVPVRGGWFAGPASIDRVVRVSLEFPHPSRHVIDGGVKAQNFTAPRTTGV